MSGFPAFLLGLGVGSLWTSALWAIHEKGRERNPDVDSVDSFARAREALRRYGPPGA